MLNAPLVAARRAASYSLRGTQALTFGLGAEGTRTRSRLRALLDSDQGETGFIVGNGPSINKTRLDLVGDRPYILLNRGYLLSDRFSREPSAICVHDPFVVSQYGSELVNHASNVIAPISAKRTLGVRDNVIYMVLWPNWKFATRMGMNLHHGHTSTFWALQLAFHLGWSRVILVGLDHRFQSPASPSTISVAGTPDSNHFDPGYFRAGDKVLSPNLVASEHSYAMSRDAWQKDGRRIVDCTPDGNCRIFPRNDLLSELAS